MQASLNELAELLAERAGRQYDVPFKAELKVMINYWRARLIVDSLNSRPKDRQFFTKWIELPLVEVNASEFPDFPNCPILRTKCEVPRPVRANSKLFDFVGKLDKMSIIPVQEPHQIKALMGSKYTGKIARAAHINDFIYVFGTLNLPGIAINMVPEDVEEFKACCTVCETDCPTDDSPYPVSSDLQQRIIQAILGTELRTIIPSDPKAQEVAITNEQK